MVVPSVIGVLLATGACSSGGGGVDEVAATSSTGAGAENAVGVPVVTEDGRMLQPAGHVGIWFETEPGDPLDRLVWKSQQFVGRPLELEPLGDAVRRPESADLSNVCAPDVFDRLESIGMERGAEPDVGLGYVLCAASGESSDWETRHIGVYWGVDNSPDYFLGDDGVPTLDESGVNLVDQGGFSEISGCIAFREFGKQDVTLFSWLDITGRDIDCSDTVRGYQIIQNSIGGYFV